MTEFYDEMAQLVRDLLAEYGTDFVITRTDDNTSQVTSYQARGVFADPKSYRIRPLELDGKEVRLILDNQVVPEEADRITHSPPAPAISRGSWIINRVDPVWPADIPLAYGIEGKVG